jgi:PAS domain S-box-containing protein
MINYLKTELYELIKNDRDYFDYIQETAPDGVWFWNMENTDENWMNPRFWKVLGYNPDEIPQDNEAWKKIVHPKDLKSMLKDCAYQIKQDERAIKRSIRCYHKKGFIIWTKCQGKPVFDENGKIKRMLVSHFELTDLRETMEELKQNEERFELMINNSTDIFVELSAEGEQKYISPVVEKHTGYKPEELKLPFTEVIHPDDVERIKKNWQKVLEEPDRIHRDEYRHIHKTKGYVWMEATLKSYLDNPNIQSVMCSVREISERKNTEKLLKQSEERYKILSNSATEMLALEDLNEIYKYITETLSNQYPNTVCLFVSVDEKHYNTRVVDIKGLDHTLLKKVMNTCQYNLIGSEFNLLHSHYVKYKSGKLALFEGGLAHFAATEFPRWTSNSIEKLLGINKIYAIGINKDENLYAILHFFTLGNTDLTNRGYIESFIKQAGIVIDRKIMEQKLKESEKRLSKANATKDKFFSIIAHDLRHPFSHLLGFSEMNLEYIENKEYDKVKDTGKIIRESAEEGYILLNNLLEWSQSEQGTVDFKPARQNLSERVRKVTSLLANIASQKEVSIIQDFKPNLTFYADANMFETILRNLVSNAIKYTNHRGTIKISAEKQREHLNVQISDTGVGIQPQNLNKLFKLEDNFTTNGTEGERGTGLGLILCKEFVEKHGGKIGVDSKPGEGTTIWFTLPYNH